MRQKAYGDVLVKEITVRRSESLGENTVLLALVVLVVVTFSSLLGTRLVTHYAFIDGTLQERML
ncbi:MAG: hypothetical protein HY587_07170 [Candidatus Omnitrophica bacterium]|nr:hypothetical protein [Candidatus Omnitrophota bacterium]